MGKFWVFFIVASFGFGLVHAADDDDEDAPLIMCYAGDSQEDEKTRNNVCPLGIRNCQTVISKLSVWHLHTSILTHLFISAT